ncbi:MAG: hypothetical protein V4608_10270 [Bacteroidota bacterium]
MSKTITYPQYRKYPHNRTYFKIISSNEWEEIQVMANKYSIHQFKAAILPDRNYIYDLTFDYENNWLKIEENEYEAVKKKISI